MAPAGAVTPNTVMAVAPVTVTGLVFGAGNAGRHLQTRGLCRVGRRGCGRARIRRQAVTRAAARCAGVAAALYMEGYRKLNSKK